MSAASSKRFAALVEAMDHGGTCGPEEGLVRSRALAIVRSVEVDDGKGAPSPGSEEESELESKAQISFSSSQEDELLLLIGSLFSDDARVRNSCYSFFSFVATPVPKLSKKAVTELVGKFQEADGGPYKKWLVGQVRSGNADALRTWRVLVQLLGATLHEQGEHGFALLNSLLQVVETSFKHSNPEMVKLAYAAWRVLMDNFALDQGVLRNAKRLNLITLPLRKSVNSKGDDRAMAKFENWWHLICLLDGRLQPDLADAVVLPFLEFCFDGHHESKSLGNQKSKKGICLEAAAILVCGLNHVRASQLTVTPQMMDNMATGALSPEAFLKHHQSLVRCCLDKMYSAIDFGSKCEISYFSNVVEALTRLLAGAISMEKAGSTTAGKTGTIAEKTDAASKSILTSVRAMLDTCDSEDQLIVNLATLADLKRLLPTSVFTNSFKLEETPALTFVGSLLRPELVAMCFGTSNRPNQAALRDLYLGILEKMVSLASLPKYEGLSAVASILENISRLEDHPDKNRGRGSNASPVRCPLWKIVAACFKGYVAKHADVNQSLKPNLDHNLAASQNLLLFPFLHFPCISAKAAFWNKWDDLFSEISMNASLIVSYKPLELERWLASQALEDLRGTKGNSPNRLANYCIHLSGQLVSSIPAQIYQSQQQSPDSIGLEEVGPILELLVHLAKTGLPLQEKPDRAFPVASLCTQISQVLVGVPSKPTLVRPLLKTLNSALQALMEPAVFSSFGNAVESQIKAVFEQAANLLQARYEGQFTSEFLQDVAGFIGATLVHPNREIRSKAYQMWQLTFAASSSAPASRWPKEVATALAQLAAAAQSGSSDSSILTTESQDDQALKYGKPLLTFENFFESARKSPSNFSTPPKSPGAAAAATAVGNPGSGSASKFRKPGAVAGRSKPGKALSLEEEDSCEFVKISSPIPVKGSKVKGQQSFFMPLTEHQKELMIRKRNDDIPALYSELSMDDDSASIVKLQEQFSQASSSSSESLLSKKSDSDPDSVAPLASIADEPGSDQSDPSDPEGTSTDKKASSRRKTKTPIKNGAPVLKSSSPAGSQKKSLRPRSVRKNLGQIEKGATTTVLSSNDKENGNKTRVKLIEASIVAEKDSARILQNKPSLEFECLVSEPQQTVPVARKIDFGFQSAVVDPPTTNGNGVDHDYATNGDEADINGDDAEVIQSSQAEPNGASSRKRARSPDEISRALQVANKRPRRSTVSLRPRQISSTSSPENAADSPAVPVSRTSSKKNKYGETPLHIAVKKGDLDRVRALLDAGADVNAKDNAGWSPLHEAMHESPLCLEVLRLLTERGADVGARNEAGRTALHDAALFMSQEVILLLLEHGADPDVKDVSNKSPMDVAPERMKEALSIMAKKKFEANDEPRVAEASNVDEDEQASRCQSIDDTPDLTPSSVEDGPNEVPICDIEDEVLAGATVDAINQAMEVADEVVVAEEVDADRGLASADPVDDEGPGKDIPEEHLVNGINGAEEAAPVPAEQSIAKDKVIESVAPQLIKKPLPVFAMKATSPFKVRNGVRRSLPSAMAGTSRGARLLEMSKKSKASNGTIQPSLNSSFDNCLSSSFDASSPSSTPSRQSLMSPMPEVAAVTGTDLLSTPQSSKSRPWQRFFPSPSSASPSASILKRTPNGSAAVEARSSALKRRRVQFTEPPVSEQVEIPPRRKDLLVLLENIKPPCLQAAATVAEAPEAETEAADGNRQEPEEQEDSEGGLYESTPQGDDVPMVLVVGTDSNNDHDDDVKVDEDGLDGLFPGLVGSDEPISTVLVHLATKTWHKSAEKNLRDNGIETVGDLCRLSAQKAAALKGLRPPNNVATITEALRKFEKTLLKREKIVNANNLLYNGSKEAAAPPVPTSTSKKTPPPPFFEESTPDEEDETMKEIYERPSPSPTEELEDGTAAGASLSSSTTASPADVPTIGNRDKSVGTEAVAAKEAQTQASPNPTTTCGTITEPPPDRRDQVAQCEAELPQQVVDRVMKLLPSMQVWELASLMVRLSAVLDEKLKEDKTCQSK